MQVTGCKSKLERPTMHSIFLLADTTTNFKKVVSNPGCSVKTASVVLTYTPTGRACKSVKNRIHKPCQMFCDISSVRGKDADTRPPSLRQHNTDNLGHQTLQQKRKSLPASSSGTLIRFHPTALGITPYRFEYPTVGFQVFWFPRYR